MTKQGTLEAENLERMNASEQDPSKSCHDSKVTCEELTLRNCSGENLDELSKLSSADNLQTASSTDKCSHTRENVLDDVGCSSKSELDGKFSDNQGSTDTASHGDAADRFNSEEMYDVKEDLVSVTQPELLDRNLPKNNCNEGEGEGEETGIELASSNPLLPSSCTRTKVLTTNSKITKKFVKDTLKDKGILCRSGSTASCGEFQNQSNPEASSPNQVDTSAPLNSDIGVTLQVDACRHQNVSGDIVRPPPHLIPNSGTLLNSNRGTIVSPTHAITNQVTNSNRLTLRPPHSVIPNSGTLLNLNRETGVPSNRAIPNQVSNLNRVTPRLPPDVIYRQVIMPLRQTFLNLARQVGLPLHQAIPNPGTLSNSSSDHTDTLPRAIPNPGTLSNSSSDRVTLPRAIPNPFPNSNSEAVMLHHDGVNLREWIKFKENKRNKVKSLHIFKQIVDAVSDWHTKGIVLLNLRPSYFILLQSNEVKYIGCSVQIENFISQDANDKPNYRNEKRPMGSSNIPSSKRIKPGENPKLVISEPHSPNESVSAAANGNDVRYGSGNELCDIFNPKLVDVTQSDSSGMQMSNSSKLVLGSANNTSKEVKWYASPEELNERQCMLSSNIYSLGILLVELLCSYDSERCRDTAMLNLRNSILPLDFLVENPREAGLCLRLLQPEPALRPSIREILESDVIKEIEDLSNSSSSSNHDDTESDLLLYFLESVQQQKHDRSSKLMEEIKLLEADIEEVEKRRGKMSLLPDDSFQARGEVSLQSSSGVMCDTSTPICNEQWLMKNFDQLEKVYFSLRSTVDSSNNGPFNCDVKEISDRQETSCHAKKDGELKTSTDGLGVFYNGLCKYARYTKFKVCGTLRNENILNSNIVSSLSFDPYEEYFAAAGVSKKIKIYDFHAVLDNNVDIQYPLIEMSNVSKLSCTSWNHYIRNCVASTDYDGVVKLWDAGTGKEVNRYTEHKKRAWSVDFSQVCPTTLASASDDHCLKLWDINQKRSATTIENLKNLCCVKFSGKSSNFLAYGSADHNTYCIDLRNTKTPWCSLPGHEATVSFVNFLDSETIVSASIDNTLKIWDLMKVGAAGKNQTCISTLRGHTNVKRFVGLSVTNDGYIMCGSETNEVFAYHRFLSAPITSHKCGVVNPITGKETDDDDGYFVSSVCSRKESEVVIAANSAGSIKVLQMV